MLDLALMVEWLQMRRHMCKEEDNEAVEKWGVCARTTMKLY